MANGDFLHKEEEFSNAFNKPVRTELGVSYREKKVFVVPRTEKKTSPVLQEKLGLRQRFEDDERKSAAARAVAIKEGLLRIAEQSRLPKAETKMVGGPFESTHGGWQTPREMELEAEEDTIETVDQPTLTPLLGEKKIGQGLRGWLTKLFGERA